MRCSYVLRYLKAVAEMKRIIRDNNLNVYIPGTYLCKNLTL